MGLFTGIKSTFKKTEAAVVVRNLLELQVRVGFFHSDPAKVANSLVAAVWDQKPDMFDGSFGQRPHKLSVAAVALAGGIENMEEENPDRAGLAISLANLLSEIEVNGRFYPLNGIDEELLGIAVVVFNGLGY
ncbi:hypothetical protein K3169_10010 [Pseudomonas phytophila]|uniref:Uncharacterized protein n=2 Tax=Pseudomonas TaxID=286 RepID=A0ABY6FKK0_9PSED|nr:MULTISPECIES: hypothetical protein [Pseudomonas]MCD5979201.1 hypothetical protein [Pseudomonas quasicaspiana]UXZ98169.1 hypothetical protein K3169_10010 [Pseudomonas phytophila]